jgi:hypothetical protein
MLLIGCCHHKVYSSIYWCFKKSSYVEGINTVFNRLNDYFYSDCVIISYATLITLLLKSTVVVKVKILIVLNNRRGLLTYVM